MTAALAEDGENPSMFSEACGHAFETAANSGGPIR